MKRILLSFFLISAFAIGKFSEKEMLCLPSANGGGGVFFNVVTVLGFLRYCEKNTIDSFEVSFEDKGLYYESALGPNWWQYFFKPIYQEPWTTKITRFLKLSKFTHVSQRQIAFFNYDGEYYLSRKKAHALIKKYIHINPDINKEIQAFKKMHFENVFVIGVHYRGTDKHTEASPVDYTEVTASIKEVIAKQRGEPIKIFVATDTQKFLDYITSEFPDQIIATEAMRSTNDKPLHYGSERSEALYYYRQGKESIIDAMLLSSTDTLIRTSSNLSLCSTFFNPQLPVIELSQKKPMKRQVD